MVIKLFPGFENKTVLEKELGNKTWVPHGVNFYQTLGVDQTASESQRTN